MMPKENMIHNLYPFGQSSIDQIKLVIVMCLESSLRQYNTVTEGTLNSV